jgi:hypothetical protein
VAKSPADSVVEALLERHGQTSPRSWASTWPRGPLVLFRLLVASSLFSARIGAGEDASAVAPSGRRPHPARARQTPPPGRTVDMQCGSGWAVPAGLVGWSEPGNQAKGGDTW